MSKVLKSTYFGHAKMIRSTCRKLWCLSGGKNSFWFFTDLFPKIWAKWIFLEKRVLSVFKYSNYLLSCKKLEKTNSRFLRKILNRRTDRQTGNQTDRQEDRQRDRRPNGQTDNSDFIGPCEKQGSKKSERQKYKTKFKTDVRQDPNNCV